MVQLLLGFLIPVIIILTVLVSEIIYERQTATEEKYQVHIYYSQPQEMEAYPKAGVKWHIMDEHWQEVLAQHTDKRMVVDISQTTYGKEVLEECLRSAIPVLSITPNLTKEECRYFGKLAKKYHIAFLYRKTVEDIVWEEDLELLKLRGFSQIKE